MMNSSVAVSNEFTLPVYVFNAYTTMQIYFVFLFFRIGHLYQVIPVQYTADIIRQQHPVIKRIIFFAENSDLIIGIQSPVTFYKTAGSGAGTDHNYFLFWLFIP